MMTMYSRLMRLWPFTIKAYAFIFIVLMSLTFGLLGWGMQYKVDSIRKDALDRNSQFALDEMHFAVDHIMNEINSEVHNIIRQKETRQQFFNRAVYPNWRDKSMIASAALPKYSEAFELYTHKGKSLVDDTIGDMPEVLTKPYTANYIMHQGESYFLYAFYPVTSTNGKAHYTLGYAGLKLDVLKAIKNQQRYNFINIKTLKLNIADMERVPLDQLFARIQFELIPNTENIALTASIERFQRQILFSMIILYFIFYLLLSSVLSAPLSRLSLHIDDLRKGQGGLLPKNYTKSLPLAELEKVRNSLNDYQSKLEEMHFSLNEKNDELWQLAHHDPLTGVYNRRGFEEDWKHMLAVSSGHRLGVALILFDCDHFKAINDTYGHPTGDQVIRAITQTLQLTLRHGDRLYRLGGDEFATLFLDVDAELALLTAERCVEAVSQYDFVKLNIKEPVRVSAGMAYAVGTDTASLNNLPKQADVAMYYAKRPGKSKIAVYDPTMSENTNILFSNSINNLIFNVMADDKTMEMHYQPIINLKTGEVDYYEALVRIRDGDNLIMPYTIFPIISERRLEAEFDIVVLGRIAKDIKAGIIPDGKGITFNVSGPGVVDPLVLDKIYGLAQYLDKYKLIIEVTETALITQLHLASSILNKLRQKGFRIALDDFGSGYSSLSYLSNMPVDCVKFDVSLIRQLFEGNRQSLIIENLAAMVIKAGYEIVAEGVESEEILTKVAQLGFSRGQGFLFGRGENTCRDLAKIPFFNKEQDRPVNPTLD
ncbi:MAG: EAL domain-containing protein [Gallionellaceae bacterium]|jgi:diguanylate cyclase (GGDEF)-like protein